MEKLFRISSKRNRSGLVIFNCNYNVKDLTISSQFYMYMELLKWWSEFRKDNAVEKNWLHWIWNNQEITVNKKPVFYMRYFTCSYGIQTMGDLCLDLINMNCYELIAKHIQKTNFLEWTGLHHSVLLDLRIAYHSPDHTALTPSFKIDCSLFDVTKKKSKTITLFLSVERLAFQITLEN